MMGPWHPTAALALLSGDAFWTGASVLIRTTVLLMIGLLLGHALRGAGPAAASFVYRATLVGVIVTGILSVTAGGALAPIWRLPLPARSAPRAQPAGPPRLDWDEPGPATAIAPRLPDDAGARRRLPLATPDVLVEQVTVVAGGTADPAGTHAPIPPAGPGRWLVAALVAVWGVGAALLLAWLASCQLSLLRLCRRSQVVTEGEAAHLLRTLCADRGVATPRLLVSGGVRSPFLAGLWRPSILLPAGFEQEFGGSALRAVLAHEVAHLARRDGGWNLLARLACALGWFQPLLWRLCRRLDQAGEEWCDQEVLAQQCPARDYADCLLALAERLTRAPEHALGVGVVPFRSALGRRIQAILDTAGRPATVVSPRLRVGVLLGTAALVALSLSAVAAPAGTGAAAARSARATSAEEKANRPAVLRGDARLDAAVTLAHKDRPMGEVLTALGKDLGIRLVAARETADDKVTLFVDGRSAAEVMALLARHFDFQWQRSHGGYELTQDLDSRAREAARRERERLGQVTEALTQMERLAQMANTPRAQLEAREGELARLSVDAARTPEERARLIAEQEAIRNLLRPGGIAAAMVFRTLTPAQSAQLRGGAEIRLSSSDGTLPAPLVDAVKQASEQRERPGRDGEREVQRIVAGITTRIGGADAAPDDAGPPIQEANVSIQIGDAASGPRPVVRPGGPPKLQIGFTLTSVTGTQNMRQMRPVRWSPTLVRLTEPPAPAATLSKDPALQREVELPIPKPLAASPPAPAGVAGGVAMRFLGAPGALPPDMPTLADVSEAIHRATGMEVIADSFIRDRLNAANLAGRRPLAQILATISSALEYDWVKEGNLLRFRSRAYPQDRLAEVPERILRPWSERVARTGAASLDDLAELAAALNDHQCRGLQEYWGWYLAQPAIPAPPGLDGFANNRSHLRFWATLNPAQRRELLAGNVLPVGGMNGVQRQAFQAALLAPRESMVSPVRMDRTPTAAELAAGGFSLRIGQMQQMVRRGTGPNGSQMATVTIGPVNPLGPGAGGGGRGDAPVTVPEGVVLEPAGAPTTLDSYSFSYHVAGDPAPARTAMINLPRPTPKP